jgi:hypothetical protein
LVSLCDGNLLKCQRLLELDVMSSRLLLAIEIVQAQLDAMEISEAIQDKVRCCCPRRVRGRACPLLCCVWRGRCHRR